MALTGHGISSHYGKPDCGSNSSSIDRPGARGWTEARDMELSATFHGSLNSPATGKSNPRSASHEDFHRIDRSGAHLAAVPASAAQNSTQLITTLPDEALPISDYYNQNVYDVRDTKIGEVNDLLVDNGSKLNAVILGVGGFLGVGEKNVAVAFPSLKLAEKDGKRYLVLNTTKEALESAPGYTYDRSKSAWMPAAKQG